MMLEKLSRVLAVLAIVLSAGGACGGDPCTPPDGELEPEAAVAGDETGGPEDTATTPQNGEAQDASEQPQDPGGVSQPDANTAPRDAAPEHPGPPMSMLDVFRGLHVGDWVRTRWTNKEVHTLLVAARDAETITIEEIVEDRGFRKAWTQIDVSIEDGELLALRVRRRDGGIEKRKPDPDAQRGTSDLLNERFRRDGQEAIRIARIEVYAAGVEAPEIRRGLFQCQRYKITVERGRWARLWFSTVKLPDYPVKISYPEENLGISLEAFGSGRESTFDELQ
ncbi:MAG: hypothetical protein JW889_00390 [Verrucomicrobia bacterium]|nr:hypothetical protein [Verrucomicrobiota bacterium]